VLADVLKEHFSADISSLLELFTNNIGDFEKAFVLSFKDLIEQNILINHIEAFFKSKGVDIGDLSKNDVIIEGLIAFVLV